MRSVRASKMIFANLDRHAYTTLDKMVTVYYSIHKLIAAFAFLLLISFTNVA